MLRYARARFAIIQTGHDKIGEDRFGRFGKERCAFDRNEGPLAEILLQCARRARNLPIGPPIDFRPP